MYSNGSRLQVQSIPKDSHWLAKYISKAKRMEKEVVSDDSCNENNDETDQLSVTHQLQEQHQLAESMSGDSDCDEINQAGEPVLLMKTSVKLVKLSRMKYCIVETLCLSSTLIYNLNVPHSRNG